jgi:hypothetical protein
MKHPMLFKAFAADAHGCNRTPIDAETIVIVLGEDDQGHSVEMSISLKNAEPNPGKLFVSAPSELKDDGSSLGRELVVEQFSIPQGPVTNVRLLSVTQHLLPKPKEVHETWPPTTL